LKDIFKGFYNLSDNDLNLVWEDPKTIFVFDTNVFLNLYGYAQQTRDDFFKILDALGNKIWMPYQVGLEYQRRRLDVIKNEKAIFKGIDSGLAKIQNVFRTDFEQLALKRRFPKLFKNTEKLEKEIEKCISDYRKSVSYWDGKQPCVRSHDEIREKINIYFNGRVGIKPLNQQYLDDIYKMGKERYDKKIPPGFKDANKSKGGGDTYFYYDGLHYEKQYGDLILWQQILEKAKDENIDSIVFITDDTKDDWWLNLESNGRKSIGPLPELQAEIYRTSNIASFHMYTTSLFLEDGKSKLKIDVDSKSIEDAIHHSSDVINEDSDLDGYYNVADPDAYIKMDKFRNRNVNLNKLYSENIPQSKYYNLLDEARKYYINESASIEKILQEKISDVYFAQARRQPPPAPIHLESITDMIMDNKSNEDRVIDDSDLDTLLGSRPLDD